MVKLAVIAVLVFAAGCAGAQNASSPAALWGSAGHVALNVSGAPAGFSAAWQFDRADNGDIRIIKEEQRGATKVNGTLISVCDDHALLFKDIVPVRRQALRELNEPILHLQMLLRLLARALPQGPLAIGAEHSINLSEQTNPIRVRKGYSARRDYGVPWRVRGVVSRGAADEVRFELAFTYADSDAGNKPAEMKLAGVWQQRARLQRQDNSLTISDWKVYRVNTFATMVAGKTELDAEAATEPLPFRTLGELRARIERDWEENPKAGKVMECK